MINKFKYFLPRRIYIFLHRGFSWDDQVDLVIYSRNLFTWINCQIVKGTLKIDQKIALNFPYCFQLHYVILIEWIERSRHNLYILENLSFDICFFNIIDPISDGPTKMLVVNVERS